MVSNVPGKPREYAPIFVPKHKEVFTEKPKIRSSIIVTITFLPVSTWINKLSDIVRKINPETKPGNWDED